MKKFECPEIEIEKFQLIDVIATSSCTDDDVPPVKPCEYNI